MTIVKLAMMKALKMQCHNKSEANYAMIDDFGSYVCLRLLKCYS